MTDTAAPTAPKAPAEVFVAALASVRKDVAGLLSRLDAAAASLRDVNSVDVATGEQLPADPAFSRGNRPAADPSGETVDPAFRLGNTAAAVLETVNADPAAAAAPAPEPAAPAETPAAAAPAPEATPEPAHVIWLRSELAKAEAQLGAAK